MERATGVKTGCSTRFSPKTTFVSYLYRCFIFCAAWVDISYVEDDAAQFICDQRIENNLRKIDNHIEIAISLFQYSYMKINEDISLDGALEEINEKLEEADKLYTQLTQENVKNIHQDALKAREMRQHAWEILAETTKRKSAEESTSETIKRSISSKTETLVYLQEKAEKDQELQLKEMLLRHKELELRKKKNRKL